MSNRIDDFRNYLIRALLVLATLTLIAVSNMSILETNQWIIGCFSAAAVLISANPKGKMAQPRSIVLGLMLSSAIGVGSSHLFSHTIVAILMACFLAMLAMELADAVHPPGGAAALIAASGSYDWKFLIAPMATGTAIVLMMRYVSLWTHNEYLDKSTKLSLQSQKIQ